MNSNNSSRDDSGKFKSLKDFKNKEPKFHEFKNFGKNKIDSN